MKKETAAGAEDTDSGAEPAGAGATEGLPQEKVVIWEAKPFDEMIDFSAYAPGEVIDVFDGRPIVRTVDGSLLILKYEGADLSPGCILE